MPPDRAGTPDELVAEGAAEEDRQQERRREVQGSRDAASDPRNVVAGTLAWYEQVLAQGAFPGSRGVRAGLVHFRIEEPVGASCLGAAGNWICLDCIAYFVGVAAVVEMPTKQRRNWMTLTQQDWSVAGLQFGQNTTSVDVESWQI